MIITERDFNTLQRAGALEALKIVGSSDGFELVIQTGSERGVLLTSHGEPRHWAQLNRLVAWLQQHSLSHPVQLDFAGWDAKRSAARHLKNPNAKTIAAINESTLELKRYSNTKDLWNALDD